MVQYGFYFNSAACAGCKTCQVACKETHGLGVNNLYRRVFNYQGGGWDRNAEGTYIPNGNFGYYISFSCSHCANPACVENCPTGATTKDEETGVVTIDKDVCIGCKTCQMMCPYSAPTFFEDLGVMGKCDMCRDEVAAGRKPVCVAGCMMRALDYGPIDELREKYGDGDVEIEPLPLNTTNPSLVINPHPKAQKSGEGTGVEVSLDEELNLPAV